MLVLLLSLGTTLVKGNPDPYPYATEDGVNFYNVSLQCPHAGITAPSCENNSTLFASLNRTAHNGDVDRDNCATCVCAETRNDQFHFLGRYERSLDDEFQPSWGQCCDGWNGTACNICQHVGVCPAILVNDTVVQAEDCTVGEVVPRTTAELVQGKRFSCQPCGPGVQDEYCQYTDLPGASFDVVAFEERANIAMRVGRYLSGGPESGEHFYHQNFYAHAAMFEGELSNCKYTQGPCAWSDAKTCLTLDCDTTNIDCPPKGLDECPGYVYDPCKHKYVCEGECVRRTALGQCCVGSDVDDDDVTHGHRYHITQPLCCDSDNAKDCEATEIFWNKVRTTFSCEMDPADDDPTIPFGTVRCYLNQDHTGVVDGFPYTCHVGNCLYPNATNSSNFTGITEADVREKPQPTVQSQLATLDIIVAFLALGIIVAYAGSRLRLSARRIFGRSISQDQEAISFYSKLGSYDPDHPATEEEVDLEDDAKHGERKEHNVGVSNAVDEDDFAETLADDPLGDLDLSLGGEGNNGGGDLEWSNVRVRVNRGFFEAVRGASGVARRGHVTALLGPSGAGKSSLLRALGGRLRPEARATGAISLGGSVLKAADRRTTMAFVPQDDTALPAALTVKEHLLFHAELRRAHFMKPQVEAEYCGPSAKKKHRLFRNLSDAQAQKEEAVRAVMSALDLSDCGSTLIGSRNDGDDDDGADGARGISGGEARRVSVAAELLGEPSVVLLDEPTSRLDARAALALAVALRRVARGGAVSSLCARADDSPRPPDFIEDDVNDDVKRDDEHRVTRSKKKIGAPVRRRHPVVLASMHQPRAEIFYEALDAVVLLGRGRVAWSGSIAKASEIADRRRRRLLAEGPGSTGPSWLYAREDVAVNPADVLMDALDEAVVTLGGRGERGHGDRAARRFRKAVDQALDLNADDQEENGHQNGTNGHSRSSSSKMRVWRRAPAWTQLRVLLDRQLLRCARAPSLLLLHAFGCLAAALCLGSIDDHPPRDLGGAQRRVEAIFFALFFLALLALTALSAFREDARVANSERSALGGLYSSTAHFISVVVVDAVALRLLPAILMAAVAYPLVGLRRRCSGLCAFRFAGALVLTSTSSGFAACALGSCVANATAANAIASLGVLAMALFGGVAVDVGSGESNSDVSGHSVVDELSRFIIRVAARCDALFYAFRAAVVGEFAGAEDGVGRPLEYVIDGHKCDPKFHSVTVEVEAILVTLDLPTEPSAADKAMAWLAVVTAVWFGIAALAHFACSAPTFADDDQEVPRRITAGEAPPQEQQRRRSFFGRTKLAAFRIVRPPHLRRLTSNTGVESPPLDDHRRDDDDDDDDDDVNNGGSTLPGSLPPPEGETPQRRRRQESFCPCGRSKDVEIPATSPLHAAVGGRHPSGDLPGSPQSLSVSLLSEAQQRELQDDDADSDADAAELLHTTTDEPRPAPSLDCRRVTLGVTEWRRDRKVPLIGRRREVLKVLNDCAFDAAPATVTALLGPSGAGKSSLLDVLAGRRTTGFLDPASVLRVDGVPTTAAQRRRLSRYAPQDDVLPPRLTAAEHLAFHGRLRLPTNWSDERKVKASAREARRLGLTATYEFDAQRTLLSRASGGQRRRVTIATELIAKKSLFFCDEPTTGLDAATALLACRRLRHVSRRGVTVVAVLHQPRPEIFWDAIDAVALVVKGKVVFVGPPKVAAEKFLSVSDHNVALNPADAMLDAVSAAFEHHNNNNHKALSLRTQPPPPPPHDGASSYDDGSSITASPQQPPYYYQPPPGTEYTGGTTTIAESVSEVPHRVPLGQIGAGTSLIDALEDDDFDPDDAALSSLFVFQLLAMREIRATSRDWPSLILHFAPAALIGVLLGVVYDDLPSHDASAAGIMDRYGLSFIICTTVGLSALSAAPRARRSARLFARERDALKDAAAPSFLASAYLGDAIPLRFLPPAILAAVAAYLSQCCKTMFRSGCLVVAAVQLHYDLAAIGRFVGALAPRDAVCAGASALVLLFSLLLCGFFVSPNDLPQKSWKRVADVLPAKYAYEALNAHMMADVDDLFIVSKVGGNNVRTGPYTGNTILRCFGLDTPAHAPTKHLILAIFGLAADMATFLALKLFARERR